MIGQIVSSKAGRDKNYFLVIVKEEDGFVYLCDGKERPIERPKRKNVKHVAFTATVLEEDSFKTNKKLRKAIAVFKDRTLKEDS